MPTKNYNGRITQLENYFSRVRHSPLPQIRGRLTALAKALVLACAGRDPKKIDQALNSLVAAVTSYRTHLDDRR